MPTEPNRPKAILCDVDGCLMPEDQSPADLSGLAQIADWIRQSRANDGPRFALCTGRPQGYAEAVCRLLHLTDAPSVCEHGVWLYDFATHTWQRDPAITDEHVRTIRDADDWINRELGPEGCFLQLGKTAGITIFGPSVEHLRESVMPRFEAACKQHGWDLRISMTWTCINADFRFMSKANGIRRLIDRLGLNKGDLVGIGDTMSDLAIREEVGFFACPGNADENLKPHADFVAEKAEAEGVLEILRRFDA